MSPQIYIRIVSLLTSEEGRKKIGMTLVALIATIFLPIIMICYILLHPIEFLKTIFSGNEIVAVEEINGYTPQYNPDGSPSSSFTYDGPQVIYYYQKDSMWKDTAYGSSGMQDETIGNYGCGPASAAIVVSSLTGVAVTPSDVAAWCETSGFYAPGVGTSYNFLTQLSQAYGLQHVVIAKADRAGLVNALKEGQLVIALMGSQTFTSLQHYIVLRGITDDEKVYVADPNSASLTKTTFPVDIFIAESTCDFTGFYIEPEPTPSPVPTQ